LAQGLAAVANRLEPKDAARYCAQAATTLTQAMAKTTQADALKELAQGLTAVAARLGPKAAAQAVATLFQAMLKTTNHAARREVARGLAAVAGRVEAEDAAEFVATFAQVMAQKTDSFLLDLALKPLSGRLTTPKLVELLKHATCVGSARRAILDQLENRYRRPFADHWAFVPFAKEQKLGLDFTTPPERPVLPASGKGQ
jgi:hypothetical protein